MKKLFRLIVYVILTTVVKIGTPVTQLLKYTELRRKLIQILDDIDLFAFITKEDGMLDAFRYIKDWSDDNH